MKREPKLSIIIKEGGIVGQNQHPFSQDTVIESPQVIQKEVPNKSNTAIDQEKPVMLQKLALKLKLKGRVKLY